MNSSVKLFRDDLRLQYAFPINSVLVLTFRKFDPCDQIYVRSATEHLWQPHR